MKRWSFVAVLALVAGMVAVVIPSAEAATITVAAGQSIQTAIDNASVGDTISVGPGTFQPFVVDKGVTVLGHNTVVQPTDPNATYGVCITGNASCTIGAGVVSGVTVKGITVRNVRNGDGFFLDLATDVTLSQDVANNNLFNGFDSIEINTVSITQSSASGNKEAGFSYHASEFGTASGDQAVGNAFGFFASDAEGVVFAGDIAKNNCAGVLLDEVFQPGNESLNIVSNSVFSDSTKTCPFEEIPFDLKGLGAFVYESDHVTFRGDAFHDNGFKTKNNATGGLVVVDSPDYADNVFSGNSFAANLPVDIGTDNTDPSVNDFGSNACHLSAPAGLC